MFASLLTFLTMMSYTLWGRNSEQLPAFYSYEECELKTCHNDVKNYTIKDYVLNRETVMKSIGCSNCTKNCERDDELCLNMCLNFRCEASSNERIYPLYMKCLDYYGINPAKYNLTPVQYIYLPGDGEYAFFEYLCRSCMNCYDHVCFLHGDFTKKCRNLCLDIDKCPSPF